MNSKLYREKASQALTKAQALLAGAGENPTPEQEKAITEALGEHDRCHALAVQAEKIEQAGAEYNQGVGARADTTGWRTAMPGEEVSEKQRHVTARVAYKSAFEAYLRRPFVDLGPNDRKTLTEAADATGGFAVPEDYYAELIKKVATTAVIRARATVAQTSRDSVSIPKVIYTTDDKYTSGVRLTWTGESPASSTTHRVTEPVFGLERIPIHTAMASMPISNDLLEDAMFDVLGESQALFAEAFALGEDDVFINGDGVAKPQGILSHPNTNTAHSSGGMYVASGSGGALTADGLVDLEAALPSQYERGAVWVARKATYAAVRELKAGDGHYLWPITEQYGNLGVAPASLLGYEILKNEFVPAIASNAYPVIFGDLKGYRVFDRVALSIQVLRELYAETNITLLLARRRLGGQLVEDYRVKVQKAAAS